MFDPNRINALLNGIQFKFIQPSTKGLVMVTTEVTGVDIDAKNTILPKGYESLDFSLQPLCSGIKRMSTYAIGVIINECVRCMPLEYSYVNVGVWNGFTLFSGMVGNIDKRCVGIDNFSEFGGPRKEFLRNFDRLKSEQHLFYELDYKEYFEKHHSGTIGIYYYDGEHSEENQYQGLMIAEPYLADDAIIIVDDYNDEKVINGTNRYLDESKLKFKLLKEATTAHNNHPTYWNGLILLQRQL